MRIVFLGPPCPTLEEHLQKSGHTLVRTEETISIDFLTTNSIEFGISYRYKHIIKKHIIEYFKDKLVNLHISLLPWNRGSDPNLWSYIDNTPKGVSIHIVDAGIDTGPLLIQQAVAIDINTATLKSSYELLTKTTEQLFINHSAAILQQQLHPKLQEGPSSHHLRKDKIPYLYAIEELWWDTPVKNLLTLREREREERKSCGVWQCMIKIFFLLW